MVQNCRFSVAALRLRQLCWEDRIPIIDPVRSIKLYDAKLDSFYSSLNLCFESCILLELTTRDEMCYRMSNMLPNPLLNHVFSSCLSGFSNVRKIGLLIKMFNTLVLLFSKINLNLEFKNWMLNDVRLMWNPIYVISMRRAR